MALLNIIGSWDWFDATTRLYTYAQHPFAVKLDKSRTSTLANTFISMSSRDWNSLQATVFPTTSNLQLFKTRTHKYLRLLTPAYKILSSSSFQDGGANPAFRGCTFLVYLLLTSIIDKKKKHSTQLNEGNAVLACSEIFVN